jgi:hypothetical protein
MVKHILIPAMLFASPLAAQNLLINPSAEDMPRGTGWTIVSAGPTACGVAPSNTFVNWTMIPDGSANYPAAHSGSFTFFSGCSATAPGGPFEIYQEVDLSAHAGLIDAGNLSTVFSGFIQTPISPQSDAGRFIVDFMTPANAVLGTSYTTAYQSFSGGSGTGWVNYTNTRIAPAGTRKVRVRLQTMVGVTPAINAYFDDISFVIASTLPLKLLSFKGESKSDQNHLQWSTSEESNTLYFAVERSKNSNDWTEIGRVSAAGNSNITRYYTYEDRFPEAINYYRLKMTDIDGKHTYSHIIKLSAIDDGQLDVKIYPVPASDALTISVSFAQPLQLKILNNSGHLIHQQQLRTQNNHTINMGSLSPGIYILQLTDKFGKTKTMKFTKQ